jgi:hypothetical protein
VDNKSDWCCHYDKIKLSIAKQLKAKVQIARVVKPIQIASLLVILFL